MSPYAEVRRDDFITDIRKLPALMKQAERERSMVDSSEAPNVQSMAISSLLQGSLKIRK